jgi:hypothetical protein
MEPASSYRPGPRDHSSIQGSPISAAQRADAGRPWPA